MLCSYIYIYYVCLGDALVGWFLHFCVKDIDLGNVKMSIRDVESLKAEDQTQVFAKMNKS